MEGVQNEWGSSQQPAQILEYVETLRQKMSGPDLSTVLDGTPPVVVTVRTSVAEAAALMREHHTTAVLVMERDSIAGIFTSKDVVLRVIAAGLDPHGCSVVRVMTPHPDCASQSLSISAALRKMNGKWTPKFILCYAGVGRFGGPSPCECSSAWLPLLDVAS